MQQFKENISNVFGEDHLNKLNLYYFFDEIGEDFNDLCKSFRDWIHNEEELTKTLEGYYLNNKSDLYNKLLSFKKKSLEKLKHLHYFSFPIMMTFLMRIISKKTSYAIITLAWWTGYNFCVKKIKSDETDYDVMTPSDLKNVARIWKQLDCMFSYKTPNNYYDYAFVGNIEEFISLDNTKLLEHLLKFSFLDVHLCLNLEYLRENLIPQFDEYLNMIKDKIKHIEIEHIEKCDFLSYHVAETETYYVLHTDTFYDPNINYAICGFSLGSVIIMTWICVYLSAYLKVSICCSTDFTFHCSYEKQIVLYEYV